MPTTTTPLPLNESDEWSVFLTVECRGMEVVGFEFEVSMRPSCSPVQSCLSCPLSRTLISSVSWSGPFQGEWKAKVPESSTVFDTIVFEDGRWDEYDEEVSRVSRLASLWHRHPVSD